MLCSRSLLEHPWKFLSDTGMRLDTNHHLPKTLRTNDVSLMDIFRISTSYNDKALVEINRCRIYLQALIITDITEGNGNVATINALEGLIDTTRRIKWNWPKQQRPPESSWKKWRWALHMSVLKADTKDLRVPLGPWISSPHQEWIWFLDNTGEMLYEKKKRNT